MASDGKENEMRHISLGDFLTAAQIQQAWDIYEFEQGNNGLRFNFAKRCEKEVIEPNITEIQVKLGQQCDSRYLSYCCEYIFNMNWGIREQYGKQ